MKPKYIHTYDGKKVFYLFNKDNNNNNNNNKEFLFFLHGAGSNHSVYKPLLKAFKDYNIIAMDYRSHGFSERAKPSFSDIIDDMLLIVKKEKIKKIILIGNSLGATIALEFYKCYPKLVKKMILITLFSKKYIRFSFIFYPMVTLIHNVLKLFKSKRKLKFMDYHKYPKRPIWYYPYLDVRGSSTTCLSYLVKRLFEYKIDFNCINIPTMVIIAKKDYITKNKLIISDINNANNVNSVNNIDSINIKKNKNIECRIIDSNHVILTREFGKAITLIGGFINK